MDDMVFPSYISSKARSRTVQFGESTLLHPCCLLAANRNFSAGDAMVRELDVSRITLRLTEKTDNKGQGDKDNIIAKLTGETLLTLQKCLVSNVH